MKDIAEELASIVEHFSQKMANIPEEVFSVKARPEKWSKKEVVGHLIDSAHNNLRRFIVGQYDESTVVVYDQDFWVKANGYQQMNQQDLILLWKLINGRICTVLLQMPDSHYSRQVNTGKESTQLHSLNWLAEDYVKHMKHHLNQVFQNSFALVYP